jgi:hypothetical protein
MHSSFKIASLNLASLNNISAHTEKKMSLNGRILMDKEVDLNYNGKIMNLSQKDYGKTVLKSRLTNNDIMKLMSKPSSKISLLERLQKDYNLSGTKKMGTNKMGTNKMGTRKVRKGKSKKGRTRRHK